MESIECELVNDKKKCYDRIYSAVSTDDYWSVERESHKRARDRLAVLGGKRVPYVVKMSIKAAVLDREKEFLEDNFNRSVVCADVIVFKDVMEKKTFLESGMLLFTKHE